VRELSIADKNADVQAIPALQRRFLTKWGR